MNAPRLQLDFAGTRSGGGVAGLVLALAGGA